MRTMSITRATALTLSAILALVVAAFVALAMTGSARAAHGTGTEAMPPLQSDADL
ncbi:hypothetical protein MRS76_09805 [Rhizobiaceae bacterium n13]|uniref:Uncharacterized protein n=1 Tax=Ferirhizobium litorale TaxID=2927786 RepID=A0AAE3QG30_9HYPH|nr:hypothetical protein [Fererhizobium litorale]MDI7862253.1 hypothetical protein [Fererhizobium litorale]MDI7922473.1 hypothetical protein [Fererhizobium litorale]